MRTRNESIAKTLNNKENLPYGESLIFSNLSGPGSHFSQGEKSNVLLNKLA